MPNRFISLKRLNIIFIVLISCFKNMLKAILCPFCCRLCTSNNWLWSSVAACGFSGSQLLHSVSTNNGDYFLSRKSLLGNHLHKNSNVCWIGSGLTRHCVEITIMKSLRAQKSYPDKQIIQCLTKLILFLLLCKSRQCSLFKSYS